MVAGAFKENFMKLLRFGNMGYEKPGLLDERGQIRDLSGIIDDVAGKNLTADVLTHLENMDTNTLPIIDKNPRLGPCVGRVGKFICVGLNYSDHAKETQAAIPAEPILFLKATSSICGPNDDIILPRNALKTDWEIELGVVIGKQGKYIDEEEALSYVAGYCVVNDISERHFQLEGTGQWTKGKSCDTFGPIGPWLVTCDEIQEPQKLGLWLEVDGVLHQNGNTKNMIFSLPKLISYISWFFTLYPGDIISTGTPAGVGHGHKPIPIYLKSGQSLHCGIHGLGEQYHTIVTEI